jgi:hypothetical protein
LSGSQIEEFKVAFKEKLAKAIARSFEFKNTRKVCTPKKSQKYSSSLGSHGKRGVPLGQIL